MYFLKQLSLFLIFTFTLSSVNAKKSAPIDNAATRETKALFRSLKKLSKNHTLFGHQHATEYGHGWSGEEGRSDVKSVTGSHPAVIGVDLSGISGRNMTRAQIEAYKERLRNNVVDTYNRGGITTISWHFNNPVSEGGFYWDEAVSLPAVKYIIPGGEGHEKYMEILKDIADWAHHLKGPNGELVPVIFRPFHEFDGDWFWWGTSHCSVEEFTTVWKFTVDYLKNELDVHNFIYAFSPDNKFNSEAEFLARYPGDDYVDLVGMDNYGDMGRDRYDLDTASRKLKIVSDYAQKAGKLAAFTETGLESIPNEKWWTDVLIKVMRKDNMQLAYVMVWRNDINSPTHFYAPFPGQVSVPNFMEFYKHPYTLFETDLKDVYKKKK